MNRVPKRADAISRRRLALVAGVAGHTVVVFVLGYLVGARPGATAAPGPSPVAASPTGPQRPEPAASRAPSPDPANWPRQSPITDFTVRVVKVTTAASVSDSLYGAHRPEGRFTLVRLTLRNRTDRPAHPPSDLPLLTAGGAEFAPEWEPTFGQTVLARLGTFNDVNPGATTTVVYVYDLPEGVRPTTVAGRRL